MTKEMKTVLVFAGIFAVLALIAMYFVNSTMNEVATKQDEIAALEKKIGDLRKIAEKHDGLIEELESLKANLAQYVKILPSPEVATEERLMELIQEKCERSQFTLGRYQVKPPKKAAAAKRGRKGAKASSGPLFKEIDVTVNAEGTFEQFLRFLNSLERHESFLRVNSFSCTSGSSADVDAEGNETWPLQIALNISTFRYQARGK